MGLFSLFRRERVNINEIVSNMNADDILLDVRDEDEYRAGHIPGSKNVPLSVIESFSSMVSDKDTRVYVYCLSGARSGRAALILNSHGFTNVINIGGIRDYNGPLEDAGQCRDDAQ